MVSRTPAFLILLPPLATLAQCGESDPCVPSGLLDPDAAPLDSGAWYRPQVETSWEIQLTGALDTSYDVDVYDVDLFDTSDADFDRLHSQGAVILCYFSAGTAEEWRDDYDQFEDCAIGNPVAGWPGEYWLDIRAENVVEIMQARLDYARDRGCDGVDPDNVDGYTNATGFDLSADDQRAYNKFLANEAHQRGLSVALKNDNSQVDELVAYYDLMVNEECHAYDECDPLHVFVANGKPVFNIEYANTEAAALDMASTLCPEALAEDFRTLIMPMALDGSWRVGCDDYTGEGN